MPQMLKDTLNSFGSSICNGPSAVTRTSEPAARRQSLPRTRWAFAHNDRPSLADVPPRENKNSRLTTYQPCLDHPARFHGERSAAATLHNVEVGSRYSHFVLLYKDRRRFDPHVIALVVRTSALGSSCLVKERVGQHLEVRPTFCFCSLLECDLNYVFDLWRTFQN